MRSCGQVVIGVLMLAVFASAEEPTAGELHWKQPSIGAGVFSDALGMLNREREEYADNLATHAVNLIARNKASAAALETGRKYLALSMHLAPRNKRALVANYQLSRGVIPTPVRSDYSPEVLAKLLATRAEILKQQGNAEDHLLARAFVELAASLDPRNEEAVYHAELQRLDHGRVDWAAFTDAGDSPGEGK